MDLPPRNLEPMLTDVAMASTPKKKPPSDLVARILEAQTRASTCNHMKIAEHCALGDCERLQLAQKLRKERDAGMDTKEEGCL